MNYESMWFTLKRHIIKKNSHGKNELLNKMVQLECDAQVEDEMIEKQVIINEGVEVLEEEEVKEVLKEKSVVLGNLGGETYIDMNCEVDL